MTLRCESAVHGYACVAEFRWIRCIASKLRVNKCNGVWVMLCHVCEAMPTISTALQAERVGMHKCPTRWSDIRPTGVFIESPFGQDPKQVAPVNLLGSGCFQKRGAA